MSRVLVCDDHAVFAEALSMALRAEGEDVVATTHTVAAALAAARLHQPDVAVVDVHFAQGPDGLTGTRELTTLPVPPRVVVLSAEVDADLLSRAVAAGADGVVSKNAPLEAVLTAVRTVAAGSFYADPALLRRSLRPSSAELDQVQLAAQFLTPRELEVLALLVRGASTVHLAETLGIGVATVRSHVHALLTKLGARTRLEAVTLAMAHGLVPPPTGPR